MLLFCDGVRIALEFDFRVAGENIRAFQISGNQDEPLELFSEPCRGLAACRIAIRIFESIVMAVDFTGRVRSVRVGGEEL
jgi:hypothetical protein